MPRAIFLFTSVMVSFLAVSGVAQRPPQLSAAERRDQREQYNRRIDDPKNNPFKRGEISSSRNAPGRIPAGSILRLEPPKRAYLDTKVSEVLDGDTIAIKNAQDQRVVIRLMGIDAPELKQEFGAEAKKYLEEKLAAGNVRLMFEPHGVPDEQGCIVARVFVGDADIATEQVRDGFAWYYEKDKERLGYNEIDRLKESQSDAKKEKLQLWQGRSPEAPWKFRKNH